MLTAETAASAPLFGGVRKAEPQSPQQRDQKQSPGDEKGVVLGIVQWSGTPALRLRVRPSRDATIVRELPFNTVLSVLEHEVRREALAVRASSSE